MQVIIVPQGHRIRLHQFNLGPWHLLVAAASLLVLIVVASILVLLYAVKSDLPWLRTVVTQIQEKQLQQQESYLRENVSAMAVRLGELQAQVARLEALGDRVGSMMGAGPIPASGGVGHSPLAVSAEGAVSATSATGSTKSAVPVPNSSPDSKSVPGRGGALLPPRQELTLDELGRYISQTSLSLEGRIEWFSLLETELFKQRLGLQHIPNVLPVNVDYNVSGFGRRIDPFTGEWAYHAGVDFHAPIGGPVIATAAGVVHFAAPSGDFGNLVVIDHGNALMTRYAHLSQIKVSPGMAVKRGQLIGLVGNTGRSTGPHLHFEVLFHGIPQNPDRFLRSVPVFVAQKNSSSDALAGGKYKKSVSP